MNARCNYIFVEGEYKGSRCPNFATINTFCPKCFQKEIRENDNPILNKYCNPKYYDKFVEYFNNNSFTQGQLNTALKVAINSYIENPVTLIIFFSEKFFPDACGYDFLLDIKVNQFIQSMLSIFFHKRFLIKSYILSQDLQLIDCVTRILDPFMIAIDKPHFYAKVMLHDVLFNGCEFINKSKLQFKLENMNFQDIRYYSNRSYLINGCYIMHKINDHYYFIGKDINNKIYDLHDDDILTVVSL